MSITFLLPLLLTITFAVPHVHSLDSLSLWSIFKRLDYPSMNAFAISHPQILYESTIRTLLECKGRFMCAYMQSPSILLFREIPEALHSHLIRRLALQNDKAAVRLAIRFGADSKWLDYPLKRAMRLQLTSQVEWMRGLLPQGLLKDLVIIPATPRNNGLFDSLDLIFASLLGRIDRVRELVALGADVNARDKTGSTALIYASFGEHLQIVQVLLEAGADVSCRDSTGNTALLKAVYFGQLPMIKTLIDAGSDVNVCDNAGITLLMRASGSAETVTALIEAGADLEAVDGSGNTALMEAAKYRTLEVVETLLKAGANVDARNKAGRTALMMARTPEIAFKLFHASV